MNDATIVSIIVAGLLFGTPLIFAAIGELISESSGVLNLSLDGTMLVSAVTGYGVAAGTGSIWIATLAAMAVGVTMSGLLAFLTIGLRVSQILAGLGLLIFGIGLSDFIGQAGDSPLAGRPAGASIEPLTTGGLTDVPLAGPILFSHDLVVYSSWALVVIAHWYLYHTEAGLRVRAVGHDPASAEAAGVSVARTRTIHVLAGGALAGIGGAYYSIGLINQWQEGLTANAGWLAIAIVLAVRWRPLGVLVAAFVFGASIRLGFTLQVAGASMPTEVLAMIPYLLAIGAVLYTSSRRDARRTTQPKALGIPFFREER